MITKTKPLTSTEQRTRDRRAFAEGVLSIFEVWEPPAPPPVMKTGAVEIGVPPAGALRGVFRDVRELTTTAWRETQAIFSR